MSPTSEWKHSNEIGTKTMQPIIELCKKLIVHAQAVFEGLERDASASEAKAALQWVLNHQERLDSGALYFKQHDLYRFGRFNKHPKDRLRKALNILQERNIISDEQKLPTPQKATTVHYINPAIFDLPA
jgi:hypothetical protein